MRHLSLQEITSISGGGEEATLSETKPSDLIPYFVAYFGAGMFSHLAATSLKKVYDNTAALVGANILGAIAGATGCYIVAKVANEKIIQPYII